MLINQIITSVLLIIFSAKAAAAEGGQHFSVVHEAFKFINFGLFIAILYIFLYKKAREFFKRRSKNIKGDLEDADLARDRAEQKLKEYRRKLEFVEKEVSALREQAKIDGKKIQERIKQEAEELSKKVIEQIKKNIELESKKARAQLQQETALLALEMAEELLKKNIKIEDHSRLIDEYLEKMERLS